MVDLENKICYFVVVVVRYLIGLKAFVIKPVCLRSWQIIISWYIFSPSKPRCRLRKSYSNKLNNFCVFVFVVVVVVIVIELNFIFRFEKNLLLKFFISIFRNLDGDVNLWTLKEPLHLLFIKSKWGGIMYNSWASGSWCRSLYSIYSTRSTPLVYLRTNFIR